MRDEFDGHTKAREAERARWTGACPSCGWGREFVAKSPDEQRNPRPVGERCKICGNDFVFLKRVPPRAAG